MRMFFASILLTFPIVSFAANFECTLMVNASPVVKIQSNVSAGMKTKFLKYEGYEFFMSDKGNSKFELEVFNPFEPSRYYSAAHLRTTEDELALAYWSRDLLLETNCKLYN